MIWTTYSLSDVGDVVPVIFAVRFPLPQWSSEPVSLRLLAELEYVARAVVGHVRVRRQLPDFLRRGTSVVHSIPRRSCRVVARRNRQRSRPRRPPRPSARVAHVAHRVHVRRARVVRAVEREVAGLDRLLPRLGVDRLCRLDQRLRHLPGREQLEGERVGDRELVPVRSVQRSMYSLATGLFSSSRQLPRS